MLPATLLLPETDKPPTMFTIFKDYRFAAGHFIPGHTGGCENLHGHNYRVRVHVTAKALDELGMVIDFADLKVLVEEVLGRFDHRVINDFPPFDTTSPTAEELAAYTYREMAGRLDAHDGAEPRGLAVRKVEVWESESSCATYEEG